VASNRVIYSFAQTTENPPTRLVNLICNATTTGTLVVDGLSANIALPGFFRPPAVGEGEDCATSITTVAGLGLTNNFSTLQVADSRLEYSLTDFGGAPAKPLRVAIIVCNSTVTGTIKIDAVSANFSSGIMEQDECASTIGKLVDLRAERRLSSKQRRLYQPKTATAQRT
jgi:hypothetical protein